ncbi:MAG: hypothetical protein Q9226_009452, partial [Calogaya cf. arnoldii]
MNETKRLDWLGICHLPEPPPTTPTWIPNLSAFIEGTFGAGYTAGGTTAKVEFPNDRVLTVEGTLLTTVGNIIHIDCPITDSPTAARQIYDEVRRVALLILSSSKSDMYPCGGSVIEAFCRTIFCNDFAEHYFSQRPKIVLRFKDAFAGLLRLIKNPMDISEDLASKAGEKMLMNLISRNLFSTDEGYMGLASKSVRSGDQVSVLLGCKIPMVLRPSDGGYLNVVGPCYINGFGDGEALLGPLPPGWKRIDYKKGYNVFTHDKTKTYDLNDPRLSGMPEGWQIFGDIKDNPPLPR